MRDTDRMREYDEIRNLVDDENVKFIRLAFFDIFGEQKNLAIMPHELKRAFEEGVAFDGSSIAGFEDSMRSDLFLKPAVVVQRRLELLPVTEVIVERFSDPVYAGLNRHKKVADRSPERRKPFVAHRRHADHDDAENAQNCKDQPVVR